MIAVWGLREEMDEITKSQLAKDPISSSANVDYNHTMSGEIQAKEFKWGVGKVPVGWEYFDDKLDEDLDKLWEQHVEKSQRERVNSQCAVSYYDFP
jgi:hypothetical protein